MARSVEVLQIMEQIRIVLGRRNTLDPDSSDETILGYLNQFIDCNMPHDVKLFENFGTLVFTIDENTSTEDDFVNGTITLQDAQAQRSIEFANISQEAFISVLDPVNNSISWNQLPIYQDPGEFFAIWGINNEEILIPGYPTAMLYYGSEFTFRTIPDKEYLIKIYGYTRTETLDAEVPDGDGEFTNTEIRFTDWERYLVYGAAANYARDFRYDDNTLAKIDRGFAKERKNMLTHTHNQIKMSRAMPRF